MDDKLRTNVNLTKNPFISLGHSLLSLGSCFSDELGFRLEEAGLPLVRNPMGTMFHPYSIFEALTERNALKPELYFENEGLFHHHRLSKLFVGRSRSELESLWISACQRLDEAIEPHGVAILTLGTAFLYEQKEGGLWVGNCLQRDSRLFVKTLSSLDQLKARWDETWEKLPNDLQIIVTVSPVRHLKDGLSENNLSKSTLKLLSDYMVTKDPHRVCYFPAFEILMDELRDYRFYSDDMLHPSPLAVEIIYKKFQECFCSSELMEHLSEWEKLKKRKLHRFLNPESEASLSFRAKLEEDLRVWGDKCSRIASHRLKP